MLAVQSDYVDVRDVLDAGDIVLFGSDSIVSRIVKTATESPISHVGAILPLHLPSGERRMLMIESVASGVTVRRLSRAIKDASGDVWIARLSEKARNRTDLNVYLDWLLSQEGKRYDALGAVWSQISRWVGITPTSETGRLFCSEAIAGALVAAGTLPTTTNVSAMRPVDIVSIDIWSGLCIQVKSDGAESTNVG